MEAVLRRSSKTDEPLELYQFGDVVLNFKNFEAAKNGKPLDLSSREFKLLKYFIEHRGEAVTRDQLLDSVWSYHGFPLTRTVDMHIAKLRQKIGSTAIRTKSHRAKSVQVHGLEQFQLTESILLVISPRGDLKMLEGSHRSASD